MKRTRLLASLLLLASTALSQGSFKISGKLAPHAGFTHSQSHLITANLTDSIKSGSDGKFSRSLPIQTSRFGVLNINRKVYQIWEFRSGNLFISLEHDTVRFDGTAAPFANYLTRKQDASRNFIVQYSQRHQGYQNTDTGYVAFLDSLTAFQFRYLNQTIKDKMPQGPEFVRAESVSIQYENLYRKLVFGGSDLERFKSYQQVFRTPANRSYCYSDQVQFDQPSLYENFAYRSFVAQFVADAALRQQKLVQERFSYPLYMDMAQDFITKLSNERRTRNLIAASFLNKLFEEVERENKLEWTDKLDTVLENMLKSGPDRNLELLQTRVTAFKHGTKFRKGVAAPAFVLQDSSGATFKLSDLKGKKLYLDIGASWCGPCQAMLPHWNALVKEFTGATPPSARFGGQGAGILRSAQDDSTRAQDDPAPLFLSISVDESSAAWQKWFRKYQPRGLVLHAGDQGFNSRFAKDYGIRSLPQYILLDEDGRILAYPAPDPASKEIRELLRSHQTLRPSASSGTN